MQQGLTQNAVSYSVLTNIKETIFTHYSNPCSSEQPFYQNFIRLGFCNLRLT